MRSEDARLVEAVDEILLLARETGARTQVSHLKACGRRNWPKLDVALARIEAAAAAGHDVRADAYPYTAYSTGFTILLEPWVKDGGDDALFARFADPVSRARIRGEIVARVDNEPGDFERIVIASRLSGEHARFTGRSIADVAAALGVEPAEAFLRVLEHERGGVSYVGHAMQESDVARVLAHPLVCVGSDGYVQPVLGASQPHPRSFGTVARVLGRYCRELGAFDLATAVRKLSADPAARAGLADRGRLLSGFHADVVVFDAAGIADRATFEEPRLPPAGIEHVVVAGQPVIEHGRRTGARPGGALRAG
jgi:N-acyl-D-amino-acid deacylase